MAIIKWSLVFIIGLHCVGRPEAQTNDITRCDQMPKEIIDFRGVVNYSPFKVFRSEDPTYTCTSAIGTGPAPLSGTNFTFVMLQGYQVKTMLSVKPVGDNSLSLAMTCENGELTNYHFMVFHLNSNGTYICLYACDDDGLALQVFRCYGHTSEDEANIQTAIDNYVVNVPGYANITNMQANCQPPPHCQP